MSIMSYCIKAKYAFLDLLYPHGLSCAVCDEDSLPLSSGVCSDCAPLLPKPPVPRHDIPSIRSLYAPFVYEEPIRRLIHDFKYNNKRYLAHFFAREMIPYLPACDWLCPVPLHKLRKKQRGYSQTNLLGEALMITGQAAYSLPILERIRDTPSQTKLNREQRKTNVQNAFYITKNVRAKTICLIDDVATTGTTLDECAKTLLAAGAKQVDACVIAF